MKLTPYQIKTANSFMEKAPVVSHDPKGDFIDHFVAAGYEHPRSIKEGELKRVAAPNKKKGSTDGWFIYHEMDDSSEEGQVIGIANYGDWTTNEKHSWSSRSERQMSDKELHNYRIKRDIMRTQFEEEQKKRQSEAAAKAYSRWIDLPDATEDHPYLKAKKIKAADGVKLSSKNDLVIPAMIENKLTTLQLIKDEGEYQVNGKDIGNKKFMAGGKSKGVYFPIRGKQDVIYIAEGYSTGMSVHMATGKFVYVCFNCHNIYNVTAYAKEQHPDAIIIIAGDDDFKNEINSGRKYAEEAARAHSALAIFPAGLNDFNDMHLQHGLDAVKQILMSDGRARKGIDLNKHKDAMTIQRPDGVLGHMFDFYNANSGMTQHGFAVQTALATCGAMLARDFKTNKNNFTSLYTISVGNSGTGKESIKKTMERLMAGCGFQDRICGDGFTSGGAVFSVLLDRPTAITSIDELGRYLEASSANKGGNQHEANTKIMEIYSRSDNVIRPPNYSTMTMNKDAKKELKARVVHNPCLTILGMTTPQTLFKNLNIQAIEDGFATRFIIYISNMTPKAYRIPEPVEVPEIIKEWAEKIKDSTAKIDCISSLPAEPIVIQIPDNVDDFSFEFKQREVDIVKILENHGMSKLPSRMNENAMRVALIHALSRDPYTNVITMRDFEWASSYVEMCMMKTIEALKVTVSRSDFEGHKKEILADLRKRGKTGITWAQMQKTPPYSQHKSQYLKELLNSIRDAELCDFEAHNPKGRGRPTTLWYATQ